MEEFAIKDCALATIATGRHAQTLRELRDILRDIHPGCIYHHFWGTLMRPEFYDREYNNDFAIWCHHSLHDNRLAERLAVIDPVDYPDLEALRQELIEIIDERLDETEVTLSARADQLFHFTRSVIVVFDTGRRLAHPRELVAALPQMSIGSIFYHFIDARRREPIAVDDFRAWLMGFGSEYQPLCDTLVEIDPYFESLFVLRTRLARVFRRYFRPPKKRGAKSTLPESTLPESTLPESTLPEWSPPNPGQPQARHREPVHSEPADLERRR